MAVQALELEARLAGDGFQTRTIKTNSLPPASRILRIPVLRSLVNQALFLRSLTENCSNSTVLHVFSNSYLNFFLFTAPVVLLGKLVGTPVVIHYHGGSAERFLHKWCWLARPFLKSATHLVVPSGYLWEIFRKYGFTPRIIPNIANLASFRYREQPPLPPRLLYTRHLRPEYDPESAVRAFSEIVRRYPEAEFRMAGDGMEKNRLAALVRQLGIADRVCFLGRLPNHRLVPHYEWANLFINSSLVDNQPVSILEAFASGLPVVTTNAGGIPYMVEHGRTGLVTGHDVTQLAEAALTLIGDEDLRGRIVRNALREVDKYTWNTISPEWHKVYGSFHKPD